MILHTDFTATGSETSLPKVPLSKELSNCYGINELLLSMISLTQTQAPPVSFRPLCTDTHVCTPSEWAIFSVYIVTKTSAAGGDEVARHPSRRGHEERQKNELPARKWQRKRAPLKRCSKHKIMKSEVEGNGRHVDARSIPLSVFLPSLHAYTCRLICLSFPSAFKHLHLALHMVDISMLEGFRKSDVGYAVDSSVKWKLQHFSYIRRMCFSYFCHI